MKELSISKEQYTYAVKRVKALLLAVNETTASDDDSRVELELMTEVVARYEESHERIEGLSVAELIRYGLEKKKMTQRALAASLGVSNSRISDFLRGRSEPNLSMAGKICKILDIPTDVMLYVDDKHGLAG